MDSPIVNVRDRKKFSFLTTFIPSKTAISLTIMFILCLMLNGDIKPITKRGFFCNDESLNYPYKKDTVDMKSLMFVALILPCILIKVCDILLCPRTISLGPGGSMFRTGKRRKISDDVHVTSVENEKFISTPSFSSEEDKTVFDESTSDGSKDSNLKELNPKRPGDIDSDNNSDKNVLIFSSVPLESDQEEERSKIGNRSPYKRRNEILGRTFSELQLFLFGFCTTMLFTGIGKITLGRMRPHFMQRCQPNVDCSRVTNENRYIEEYTCTNPQLVPRDLSYITTSWPSGHAAIVFYSMLYVIIHLNRVVPIIFQSNKHKKRGKFYPLMLYATNVLKLGIAGYIALTRISDYHHHPFDVFCGTIIGTFVAIWLSKCFAAEYSRESM